MGCTHPDSDQRQIPDFPVLPENNMGTRARSITYVYDKTPSDASSPMKKDSSIMLFSYDASGNIDSMRFSHNDGFIIYDFSFERNASNKLIAMHCETWADTSLGKIDCILEYNPSGNVSQMKYIIQNHPTNDIDTFLVRSTGSRIDTVIDRTLIILNQLKKYAYTYNGSGDITQVDVIGTSGSSYVYEDAYKYTISGSPAALIMGNEAIYWYFFAKFCNVSGTTKFMIPPILFQSPRQSSKLVYQSLIDPVSTSNYQTEYYSTGKPKKMTANVTTPTGSLIAREAYYYTYAQ